MATTPAMKVLITGAASGIGAAIAARFAADAARQAQAAQLLLVDRDDDGLRRVATGLRSAGSEVATIAGDLAHSDTPARAVAAMQERFGGLDVLVSNAGISVKGPLLDCSLELFDQTVAVNLRATFLLGKVAHSLLAASKGCIIATASIGGTHPTPMSGPYSATKAGLILLIRQMALEWGPDGIRANTVSPGAVPTNLSPQRYATEELREYARSSNPLHTIVSPEQIADAVAFLAGNTAMTGADLVIDAGRTMTTMNASARFAVAGNAPPPA